MKLRNTQTWIAVAIAAGLLAGCSQNTNTAKDDSTAKPAAAPSGAPYNPADQSKAPPQFPNQATVHTIGQYGTGQSTPQSQ